MRQQIARSSAYSSDRRHITSSRMEREKMQSPGWSCCATEQGSDQSGAFGSVNQGGPLDVGQFRCDLLNQRNQQHEHAFYWPVRSWHSKGGFPLLGPSSSCRTVPAGRAPFEADYSWRLRIRTRVRAADTD